MKRLLREPLVHFLLLGAALFAAYGWIAGRPSAETRRIAVTPGEIAHLAATYERVHQRPPTADELAWSIDDYVREEIYVREATALGLDRDDAVIRQRLRQKMEFLSNDVAALAEPTDEDLRAYLKQHADGFRIERSFTFRQVYLNPDRRREDLSHDAAKLLAELRRAPAKLDLSALGDSFLLDHDFEAVPGSEVAKEFGEKFARALDALALGEWQGPIESGYGAHLVLVSERSEGRVPALEEVRDAVEREWTNARRLEANEKFFRELRARYSVTIERPPQSDAERRLAEAPQ